SSGEDITERKQAEEKLRESEERLRFILDSTNTGILIIDTETRIIVEANPYAIEMIGDSKEDIIGSACHRYICPAKEGQCPIIDLGQEIDNSERLLLKGNGGESPILKTVSKITIDGKEHLLESFIDITERKRLENQLQQAQKMEAIGTLAGGIAHDFNNILFPIIGYTEMTMEDVPEDSIVRKNLNEILTSALRAKDLVQQILTFSRKQEQELKPIKVQVVVNEALTLIRSSLPTTIEISREIEKDCGLVMADSTKIHQIVMNLCTNAYHAMRETGGVLEVNLLEEEISTDDVESKLDLHPGRYAKLTIKDTGHGIDSDALEKIFEPYFTTKPIGEGSGLGLAVVHGIVKSCGGEMSLVKAPHFMFISH
ncbi:MAG: PAS domain S-box protein, partial [Deltaproteobacteria bacterium]|nr:PAS domain S-box protein [Deltaproteobacteria bacterium]